MMRDPKASANVKDYGAVGDGVTDDTEAIHRTIDAAGWAYLPEGTYRVGPSLTIPGGTGIHEIK